MPLSKYIQVLLFRGLFIRQIILCLFLLFFLHHEATAQVAKYTNTPSSDLFFLDLGSIDKNQKLTLLPSNPPPDKDELKTWPQYGVFWIFADGTYVNVGDKAGPISKSKLLKHKNLVGGNYFEAAAYLTEKYTNGKPPNGKNLTIGDGINLSPATTVPFNNMISVDRKRKIALDYNHKPRQGYESVYAISYLPDDNSGGKVILFYNGKKVNNAAGAVPSDLSTYEGNGVHKHKQSTYFPAYYDADPESRIEEGLTNSNGFSTLVPNSGFKDDFGNYISYQYTATEGQKIVGTGIGERRIFHVLNNDNKANITAKKLFDDSFNFLALLTESTATNAIEIIGHPFEGRIRDLLGSGNIVIHPNNSNQETGMIGNDYLVDIVEKTLDYKSSHDPNSLCITKVCDCADQKEDNNCQASFDLTVCNTGNDIAGAVKVSFKDVENKGFTCLKVYNYKKLWENSGAVRVDSFFQNLNGANFEQRVDIPAAVDVNTNAHLGSKCIKFNLTVNVPPDVCLDITDTLPCLIEALVEFPSGEIETSCSEKCELVPFDIDLGTACVLGCNCPESNGFDILGWMKDHPWATSISTILLFGLFFGLRKKKTGSR